MKKTVWRYDVRAYGIKKRCRKEDWTTNQAPLGEENAPDEAKAKFLAKEWIFINMKDCKSAYATARLWTINHQGMETWEPFTDEHNLKWRVDL